MSSTLISDLRVALAPRDLKGLDAGESVRVLSRMDDVEELWTVCQDHRRELDQFAAEGAAAHREGQAALAREEWRRYENGEVGRGSLDSEQFLMPPLKRYLDKWESRRPELERMRRRLHVIEAELQARFDRGVMPAAVATLYEALKAAARGAVRPERKTCKSCGTVTTLGDPFESKRKAEALREQIRKETPIAVRASLADLANEGGR